MKTIELDQATRSLAEYAQTVSEGPVVLTVGGKPVAALVSIDDTDLETISLSTNPDFIALIADARRRRQREGGLSIEEVRQRLGL
jgi:prevent-host-death family protein